MPPPPRFKKQLGLTAIPVVGSIQYCVFATPDQNPLPFFRPSTQSTKVRQNPTE